MFMAMNLCVCVSLRACMCFSMFCGNRCVYEGIVCVGCVQRIIRWVCLSNENEFVFMALNLCVCFSDIFSCYAGIKLKRLNYLSAI